MSTVLLSECLSPADWIAAFYFFKLEDYVMAFMYILARILFLRGLLSRAYSAMRL